jgi:hypothetical protein
MQLALPFENLPPPSNALWLRLDDTVRQEAIEKLARLIAQAAEALPSVQEAGDE